MQADLDSLPNVSVTEFLVNRLVTVYMGANYFANASVFSSKNRIFLSESHMVQTESFSSLSAGDNIAKLT